MSIEIRTRRSRWASVLGAAVLVGSAGGCGSHGGGRAVVASGPNRADVPSPPLASEGSSATTPTPRSRTALRNPSVLPALPARPILDLGPVLVEAAGGETPSTDVLLVQADRLGADGFVLETEGLGAVYGLDDSREAAWRKQHPHWSVAFDVARFLSFLAPVTTPPHGCGIGSPFVWLAGERTGVGGPRRTLDVALPSSAIRDDPACLLSGLPLR